METRSTQDETGPNVGRQHALLQLWLRPNRFLNHKRGVAIFLVMLSFAGSYVCSWIASYSAAYGDWPYAPVQLWKWPSVWFQFADSVWSEYLTESWLIALALLLALGAIVRIVGRGRIRQTNSPALNIIASSLVSFLLMGSLAHVQSTEFEPRFALQSMVLLQVGMVTWALLPVHALVSLRVQNTLAMAGILLFLSAPAYLYGWPSLTRVRIDIHETLGKYTAEVLESGATHIVGDYWKVWPTTFDTNLALYEMGSERRVWGVTVRSGPTRVFWSKIPLAKMRLAAIAGDDRELSRMLEMYSFPRVKEERRFKNIVTFKPLSDYQ